MQSEGSHALFVVSEYAAGFAGREVVHAHGAVETRADDLRIAFLCFYAGDGARVARQDVDVRPCAHIPDPDDAVPTSRGQDVESRVDREGVYTREMAVVVPDDLVGFQVPAFDHFVLAAGEEVGVPRGNGETAHGGDVAGQGEAECAGCEVPDLDGAVAGAGGEPVVVGLDGEGTHPP